MSTKKELKRMANILYRLRKKGYAADTRQKIAYFGYGGDPNTVLQVKQLRDEFNFTIQFRIYV